MEEEGVSPRQRLAQAKQKIKIWEGAYKATYGCPPDREVMAQAPEDIRHAYKTYRYYRKAVAEQNSTSCNTKEGYSARDQELLCHSTLGDLSSSLSVVCDDNLVTSTNNAQNESIREQVVMDGGCDSAMTFTDDINSSAVSENRNKKVFSENSLKETKNAHNTMTNSGAKFTDTYNGTWGKHLNKDNQCPATKEVKMETSLYTKMAEKLRDKSTIKTRISLSRTSSISKSQKQPVLSASLKQASRTSICDESNDPSNNSKGSCNSDLSFRAEDILKNDSISSISESNEFFYADCNKVDELRPLSAFNAVEPNMNRTFNTNNMREKLKPLSILNTVESESSNTLSVHESIFDKPKPKSMAVCDALESDPFESITKFHEIQSRVKAPVMQPLSALSTLSQTHMSGLSLLKKRASLDFGWVARCTETSLDKTDGQIVPQESWKMQLIDKEWSEDAEENTEPQKQSLEQGCDDVSSAARNTIESTKITVKKPGTTTIKTTTRKVINNTGSKKSQKTVDRPLPTQNNEGRVLRARSIRNVPKPDYADISDEDCSISGDFRQGERQKRRMDEDEEWQDFEGREELADVRKTSHSAVDATEDSLKRDSEPVSEVHVRKRKKVETLEELEEQGKIRSQWPPPKKKRVARKKPAAGSRAKKVSKENSPKIRRALRKRKAVKPEEEEEDYVPDKCPQQPVINMDYDETDDIELHGTKNTKSKGKYLTGEERLMKKISSGTLNNNFVRINLKKKIFVRGKKTMTSGKYKRQEWKKKQILKSAENGNAGAVKNLTCFKCGDFGHWARSCPGKRGDSLTPLEEYNENASTFLSLEEAASMALGIKKTDSELPVSKLYPTGKGFEVTCENMSASNNGEINIFHSPNLQEKPDDDEIGIKTVYAENQAVTGIIDQEHLHDTGSNTTSNVNQDTDSQQLISEAEYDFRDSDDDIFASLEETEFQQQQLEPSGSQDTNSSTVQPDGSQSCSTTWQERSTVKPLYPLSDGEVIATPEEVYDALRMFGYPSFRPGQEDAIMRILSGQSTLLVLSTGSGKSLCYQLPAYLFSKYRSPCITLCVSPLVSLMEDQVAGLPRFLRAVCLHTHQNPTQRSHALTALHSRAAHILLVSPEAVVASRTGGVLGTLLKELPPVAFACLDEAHCVSEWSHNFRPSYLRVCQVLRERLGVKTILGLTATARHATAVSIARHLLIPDFDTGVIRGTSVPDNLQLSVSRDQNREEAVVGLLQGERFSGCSSIIIYCTRRDECERVATLLRTQLLDPSKVDVKSNLKRNRGLSFDAEAYHAGLSSHRRHQVQKNFMSGKLRIVVATVAFGMGIDKSDVQGIIHFNMPRNVESYVQEIGRAGRDGKKAHCHLFLDDQDGRDIQELKRHIFANSVDRHTIRKLLNKIFQPCKCAKLKSLSSCGEEGDGNALSNMPPSLVNSSAVSEDRETKGRSTSSDPLIVATTPSCCPRHEVAIPIEAAIEELDLPEENLETLLCYLELHQENLIHISSHVYANCTVSCYGGPRQLVAVSRRCPPLAVAIALERQKGKDFATSNRVTFPVVEVSSCMGWNSKIVKRELKSLEWNTQDLQNGGKAKRSGVVVEMTDLSFHLEARGDLSDDERDRVLDSVYHRAQMQEQDKLRQLHYTYQLLRSISHATTLFCCDFVDQERCNRLRTELREYFRSDGVLSEVQVEEQASVRPEVESGIRSSVRSFLSTYDDQQWTGRAVARVFHGIGSPNYPTEVWGRVRRYWRQHLNVDFNVLVSIATQEILRCK